MLGNILMVINLVFINI